MAKNSKEKWHLSNDGYKERVIGYNEDGSEKLQRKYDSKKSARDSVDAHRHVQDDDMNPDSLQDRDSKKYNKMMDKNEKFYDRNIEEEESPNEKYNEEVKQGNYEQQYHTQSSGGVKSRFVKAKDARKYNRLNDNASSRENAGNEKINQMKKDGFKEEEIEEERGKQMAKTNKKQRKASKFLNRKIENDMARRED